MEKYLSPLRYPGGKKKLCGFIVNLIKNNQPIENIVEPYAGGGGVALHLLTNNLVKKAILNDYDKYLSNFWESILIDTDLFIERIRTTSITRTNWKIQKEILFNAERQIDATRLDIGFAFFFVNRCSRSGMVTKNVGPIGGKKQKGKWKINARFKKGKLIKRIKEVSENKKNIQIYSENAIDFLNKITTQLDMEKTLIYLDPPYFEQGPNLYRKYYNISDHNELQEYLTEHNDFKWVLSYDNAEYIESLYDSVRNKTLISFDHHANNHKKKDEVLFASDKLIWV